MTNRFLSGVLGLIALIWLSGCVVNPSSLAEADTLPDAVTAEEKLEIGVLLLYVEREPGSESFTTRMFANERWLHISDSRSPADYIFFDRTTQTLYNVNQNDRSIFVIKSKPVDIEPPIVLDYQEESQSSGAIPKVDGRQATHYRFYVNGEHCYDSVVLSEDFMPEVLGAMREFRQVLAGEHATMLNNIPGDRLDACDLSLNIFESTKHMDHGLPIREWDRHGHQRFLKDYRLDVSVSASTFELPKDFRRYSVGDVPAAERLKKIR
jgi:hypothetical protein